MPSYASVAAKDLPPSTEWPQPDPNLLSTEAPSGSEVVDDSAKVAVVASDFKENPQSEYTENIRQNVPKESSGARVPMPTLRDDIPSKARRAGSKAKAEGVSIWDHATNFLLRPGVAGGLIGLVNVGLLTGVGYSFYSKPLLRRDTGAISTIVASGLGLLLAEGYLAEQYAETPEGQRDVQRVKSESQALARYADDLFHRPSTLQALAAALNATVAGSIGYYAYANWNRRWDRATVSSITAGVLALVGVDGFLLEQYKEL
ncbi:hypothetical protein BKA70DRAFT_1369503 [Coprinopsis sp. MPI-PUGE-AT-0042]|nr:hypothetical protein BKA70DRAFT_1369503 [Coprinopsis sp. MPI-PUGE-AT-0042]